MLNQLSSAYLSLDLHLIRRHHLFWPMIVQKRVFNLASIFALCRTTEHELIHKNGIFGEAARRMTTPLTYAFLLEEYGNPMILLARTRADMKIVCNGQF